MPDMLVHPGVILREEMKARKVRVGELADALHYSHPTVSYVTRGHRGITVTFALGLERLGFASAEFWMRLQADYDVGVAKGKLSPAR